jgi:Tfp pilus assembly protein PilN
MTNDKIAMARILEDQILVLREEIAELRRELCEVQQLAGDAITLAKQAERMASPVRPRFGVRTRPPKPRRPSQ